MIDENDLLELGNLLNILKKSENKWTRAEYRFEYYSKITRQVFSDKLTASLETDHIRWRANPEGLKKKLEESKVDCLNIRGEWIQLKQATHIHLTRLLEDVGARIEFNDGKMVGLRVGSRLYNHKEFQDLADQYEANKALNQILSDK